MSVDLVVIGLGYVGLPLAREACASGLLVAGLDRDPAVVAALSQGTSRIDGVSDADVVRMRDSGFRATSDPSVIGELVEGRGTVVICVPTPLSEDGGPDLSAVLEATDAVAKQARTGTLVVLESTTYPGTTEEVIRPRLEAAGWRVGVDLFLAFSPERIDPGNMTFGVRNTPKILGGVTPACADRAEAFYSRLVDVVVRARGTREAEMAKLLENTYRHVNIALVNEMAKFCHELGIDLWDVIRCASTKPFGFQPFHPGPGVGGHCIPIDPNYLSYRVRAALGYPFRFVELAQEINHSMPGYIVRRIQDTLNRAGKPLRGSTVLLLGVTYKEDISDQRESSAVPIARELIAHGATVRYHDPFVASWTSADLDLDRVGDVDEAMAKADLTVLLQRHSAYDMEQIAQMSQHLLDTRGAVPAAANVEHL